LACTDGRLAPCETGKSSSVTVRADGCFFMVDGPPLAGDTKVASVVRADAMGVASVVLEAAVVGTCGGGGGLVGVSLVKSTHSVLFSLRPFLDGGVWAILAANGAALVVDSDTLDAAATTRWTGLPL
jgi:hypothetical protein